MIVTTKFLKPEEMNVEFTIIMPLAEVIRFVADLETAQQSWVVDNLKSALRATVREVQQAFTAVEHNPIADSEETK